MTADISGNLLQVGGAASGLGVIFFMVLKLLEKYGSVNKDFDQIIKAVREDRDEWREKAIRCESEAKTLKKQMKEMRATVRDHIDKNNGSKK